MGEFKSSLAQAATVIVLATGPAYGADKAPIAKTENVTAQTRQKVAELQAQFPKFVLSTESRECLDGKLIDAECDPSIVVELRLYRKQQELNAKQQELNAKQQELNAKQQGVSEKEQRVSEKEQRVSEKEQRVSEKEKDIAIMTSARDNISILIGLVQLGLYVDYEKIPRKDADYMDIVMSNPNTPKEVQSLFVEFLKRKKSGGVFTWKADGKRLIDLANKHLQIANTLQGQLKNETFKQQAAAMYSQANQSYTMGREMLAKKA